jgi:hypothetical protein
MDEIIHIFPMIKILKTTEAKSVFLKEKLYDLHSKNSLKIKLFGITVYNKTIDYSSDINDKANSNNIGFGK